MPSINFNQSAQVALMTLNKVNKNLFETQDMISTGKKIATAKDNASVWAISTVMESDAAGFKQITDSLNLGSSTVEVARAAAEQVTGLLQEMKALVVSAQENNVDRDVIQKDVDALRNQIVDIVDAAQFNGLNLLKGENSNPVTVLSSLDRDPEGLVTPKFISVQRQNLEVEADVLGTDTTLLGTEGSTAASTGTLVGDGTANLASGETIDLTFTSTSTFTEGDTYSIYYNGKQLSHVVDQGEGANEVINGLYTKLRSQIAITGEDISVARTLSDDLSANDASLVITANAAVTGLDAGVTVGGTAGGGLGEIANIDVSNTGDPATALGTIETMIDIAVTASASFGSAQNRIEIQNDFLSALIGSVESGISALTDANLEEASARLQALQVQQQLNIQALSIANQAPQALLSLFQ